MFLEIEIGLHDALACAGSKDQFRQRAVAIWADDQADVLGLQQSWAEALRHAAGDSDDRVGLHVPLQLAQTADDALFRVIADRAGVHQDHIRPLGTVHRRVAFGRELSEHQLGIAHVHLAAVGFDVDGSGHAKTGLTV